LLPGYSGEIFLVVIMKTIKLCKEGLEIALIYQNLQAMDASTTVLKEICGLFWH